MTPSERTTDTDDRSAEHRSKEENQHRKRSNRSSREDSNENDVPRVESTGENRQEHLESVPVGAGCTEIWDHLGSYRQKLDGDESTQNRDGE